MAIGRAPASVYLIAHPVYRVRTVPRTLVLPAGYLLSLSRTSRTPGQPPARMRTFHVRNRALVDQVLRAIRDLSGVLVLPWVIESEDALEAFLSLNPVRKGFEERLAVGVQAAGYLAHRVPHIRQAGLRSVAVGDPLLAQGHVRVLGLHEDDFILLATIRGTPAPDYAQNLAALGEGKAKVIWPYLTKPRQVECALEYGIPYATGPMFGTGDWRIIQLTHSLEPERRSDTA